MDWYDQPVEYRTSNSGKLIWGILLAAVVALIVVLFIVLIIRLSKGVPVNLLPVGDSCSSNTDCQSNNCSLNICQNSGTTTGQLGAYCNSSTGINCNNGLTCQNNVCSLTSLPVGSPCTNNSQCASQNCNLNFCQMSGTGTGQPGAFCRLDGLPGCASGLACVNGTCAGGTPVPPPSTTCPAQYMLVNGQCLPTDGQPCASDSCYQAECTVFPSLFYFTDQGWQRNSVTPGEAQDLQVSYNYVWLQTAQGILRWATTSSASTINVNPLNGLGIGPGPNVGPGFGLGTGGPGGAAGGSRHPNWDLLMGTQFEVYYRQRTYQVKLKKFHVVLTQRVRHEILFIVGTVQMQNELGEDTSYDGLFQYIFEANGRARFRPFYTTLPNLPGSLVVRPLIGGQSQPLRHIEALNFQYDASAQARMIILADQVYYTPLPVNWQLLESVGTTLEMLTWPSRTLDYRPPLLTYEISARPAVIVLGTDHRTIHLSAPLSTTLQAPGWVQSMTVYIDSLGSRWLVALCLIGSTLNPTTSNVSRKLYRYQLPNLGSVIWPPNNSWQQMMGSYSSQAIISSWLGNLYLVNREVCINKPVGGCDIERA